MSIIEDAIRGLFWAIAKLFLAASDWMYTILESIVKIDLSNNNIIKYTWLFFLCFLSFACTVRIGYMLLRKLADENEEVDFGWLLRKITNIFLVVALSTTGFFFMLQVPSAVTTAYNNAIVYDEKLTPSSSVISATAKTPIVSDLSDMSTTDEIVTIDVIDEKLNDEEDGEYVYFVGYAELLMCMIGAFVVMCVQLNIVIDCAMRLFLNIFRFVIGFIPISSMLEDKDSTCGDWVRDILSDTMTMCCTLIFTNMVFGLMTVSQITKLNGIIRIVVFAVGLMTVYKSGELIAKYLHASNLSSGGRLGTILLGVGAMSAARGAMNIMQKSFQSMISSASSAMHGSADYFTNRSANINSNHGFNNPSSSSMLGASINNPIDPDGSGGGESYFINSGINQQEMQSSQIYQNNEDSILDQNPMTYNQHTNTISDENQTNDFLGSSQQGINDTHIPSSVQENQNIQSIQQNELSTQSVNQGQQTIHTSQMNEVQDGTIGHLDHPSTSTVLGTSGVSFVDEPAQTHLYKNSQTVYKPDIKDVFSNANQSSKTMLNGEPIGGES